MEGFLSPPRRGLLLFEGEGPENFAELDLKPHFTPMIWYLRSILGFGLKKKKIKEKNERNKEGKYFFSFYTLRSYSFPFKKKFVQKTEYLFKFDMCQQSETTKYLTTGQLMVLKSRKPPSQTKCKGMTLH